MDEIKMPVVQNPQSEIEESPIVTLSPKQQRFVHLYLTGQYTIPKLAEVLDVHINTVRNWLKRDDMRTVINDYQRDEHQVVEQGLKALRFSALRKLGDLVESPIDGVALQAVKDILDRTGHKPMQEKKVDITVTTFEKQIMELADTLIEDVEYEITE